MSTLAFDTTNVTAQAALFALRETVDAGGPMVDGVAGADRALQIAERLRRLSAVAAVDTIQSIDDSRVFIDQGHSSARVMAAHLAGLSGSDAFRLDKIRRMVTSGRVEQVTSVWRAGELGIDQTVLLAKIYANPRTRDNFIDDQLWLIDQAQNAAWPKFERRIARWVELADDDGADPAPDPTHERRDASLAQDHFSKAWHLRAQLGSLAGSRFAEILQAYIDAEFAADWEAGQAVHGQNLTKDQLGRTDAQRRADALVQMAEDAAANTATSARVKRVHNIVYQGETAEELFRRWAGERPRPFSPDDPGVTDLDGNSIHDHTALADLITGSFRRVIRNADGVTIDMSREQRFFTGLARLGVELQRNHCYWPGCHRPVTQCNIDHLKSAARSGLTEQSNGGPACPTHNRRKEAGYVVTRRPGGTFHITTPNGHTVR